MDDDYFFGNTIVKSRAQFVYSYSWYILIFELSGFFWTLQQLKSMGFAGTPFTINKYSSLYWQILHICTRLISEKNIPLNFLCLRFLISGLKFSLALIICFICSICAIADLQEKLRKERRSCKIVDLVCMDFNKSTMILTSHIWICHDHTSWKVWRYLIVDNSICMWHALSRCTCSTEFSSPWLLHYTIF